MSEFTSSFLCQELATLAITFKSEKLDQVTELPWLVRPLQLLRPPE